MSSPFVEKDSQYAQPEEQLAPRTRGGELKPSEPLPNLAEIQTETGAAATASTRTADELAAHQDGTGALVAEPKMRATHLLGVASGMTFDRSTPPYWVHLMEGARREAEKYDYHLVMLRVDSSITATEKFDGVLFANLYPQELALLEQTYKMAISVFHNLPRFPSVVADEAQGVQDAVKHLLSLGHRRIAYMACEENYSQNDHQRRVVAYREALAEAGIDVDERWVRHFADFTGDGRSLQGFANKAGYVMNQWIKDNWRQLGCTAILAYNDESALGIMDALRSAGIRVPAEVSVVGFDGTEVSTFSIPKLTTVEMPLEEIGARAVALLLGRIAGEELPQLTVLPTKLIVRDSTALAR